MSPVPNRGGNLVAILPLDAAGECSCSPEDRAVITTTTAVAYPDPLNPNAYDLCVVRLVIDNHVFSDVNLDKVINETDTLLIVLSPYYNLDPSVTAESLCPVASPEGCGRADVNRDGKVNQLDMTSVLQSAKLGTPVPCGGVYASEFSCGSSRKAPLVPAIGISLDNIQFFSDDGLMVSGFVEEEDLLLRRSSRVPVETLQCDMNHQIMSHVTSLQMESSAHAHLRAQDQEAHARVRAQDQEAHARVRAQDQEAVRQLKEAHEASEKAFEKARAQDRRAFEEKLRQLQGSGSPTHGMLGAVAAVVAVVAASVALLALVLSFRRNTSQ